VIEHNVDVAYLNGIKTSMHLYANSGFLSSAMSGNKITVAEWGAA
jgi:hypothetical protein